jgi:hypothetical protein
MFVYKRERNISFLVHVPVEFLSNRGRNVNHQWSEVSQYYSFELSVHVIRYENNETHYATAFESCSQ